MSSNADKIAVVGMACRFPGAENIDEFWNILIEGRDTIKHFTDEELEKSEFEYENLRNNPDYVKAKGVLKDIDKFDPMFFGYLPKEAAELDPQYRIWLETVWSAFENAGCDPLGYDGKIGVFAGGSVNTYLLNNVLRSRRKLEHYIRMRSAESFQTMIANEVSGLPTKTAYKFNLRGPAINVQTACSTSLVAVSMACQSLLLMESDMCIAGGVAVSVPQETGYMFQEGGITSPDGCCRSFDSQAKGTVFSNGVGVVVLKRLEDAIRDKDIIYSIVSGWALNNDGNAKISYVAPSIDGQAEVIKMAQYIADVHPEDIGYIEAHGTATPLGDPIELTALTNAFSLKTDKKQFCGIGSVKSNIGHTDVVAGIAGFIKASLSIFNKTIPPTIHYSKPNPYFNFEDSPFFVQDKLKKWEGDKPLIIGVSSLGIGGTNVHVILEEPPVQQKSERLLSEWPELVLVSAKSQNSLLRRKQDLVDFFKTHPEVNISDVAYSLKTGRNHMKFRSFTVASSFEELISQDLKFTDGKKDDFISKIAFMFPGQGAQYISMGYDLYKSNVLFRQILDDCFEIVGSETGEDLKRILFQSSDKDEAEARLASTEMTQPALFIIEYALARVFIQFGIKPSYLIGHSIGEYTAACIAGVFDLQTALKTVLTRGRLMKSMPTGSMMAVQISHAIIETLKEDLFEIAADNADNFCTISMKPENVVRVKKLLEEKGIHYIPLNTSHAFHSADFDPILNEFSSYVNQFRLSVPKIPFISCLTGEFITDEQAVSGSYWAQQLRNSVLFRKGITTIMASDNVAFLEVGPNTHLSSLVRQNAKVENKRAIIATLGKADKTDERYRIIAALGNIFNTGIELNSEILQNDFIPPKISLPSYPFDRIRCWIDFNLSDVKDDQILSDSEEKSINLLKEPEIAADEQINLMSPAEKTSNIILKIWKSLFGIDEIGPEDNFFDIGGHSLLALQILTRIKEDLGYKVSLKDFLEHPTINKLTHKIIKENPAKVINEDLIYRSEINSFPLSYIQKRIWIISQFDGLNPAYNIPFTLHFKGDVNLDIFRQSVNLLFNRHFTMFSVFKQKEGEPYCEIIPRPVDVEFFDFSDSTPETREEKIFAYIQNDSRKKFNLETGPLYRLCLLKQNDSSVFFQATIHHLIFDGWSWSIFITELRTIYECLLLNIKIELPDVKNYYLEYARELLAQDNMPNDESSSNYWVENLRGCTPQLNFPFDFPRKDVPSGFGEKESITISTESTAKLKKIALREHATPFATLLSLMGLLYQRYSGENDICIGTHVANRPTSSQEKIFGMFVNTIPVRLRIDEVQTLSKLINSTKDGLLEAISHQELPFEKIVELVNPERSSNVNPIFQVAVQWLTYSSKPLDFVGFTAEHVDVKEGISTFDITFNLWENEGQIEGEIEYNVDVLSRPTVIRLRDNFLRLIESAVEDPEQAISRITIVSENDRKMLAEFNNTEASVSDCLVQNLFEEQALIQPMKVAVTSGTSKLTYRELNEKSNQIARHLISLGVTGGDVVGICIERSTDMVVSVLGVLKAGCCYLPMDPSFPDDRISYMYEDSGARVLISQSSLKNKFDQFPDTSIVLTDSDSNVIGKYLTEKPEVSIDNQSLAYIIYTSGSTGKPKGVKVHHKAVVNFLNSMLKKPGFSKDDRLLAVTTLSFDISVLELFLPLSAGADIVIADAGDIFDGQKLSVLLEENDITVMQATPATWNILLGIGWKGKKNLKALCGGEAILPGLVRELLPKVDSLWDMYGPTETTVWSTCKQLTDHEPPILVGKPVDNTSVYILDKNQSQLPVGVVGEVCIGGLGVTKGYHNRQDLTAEKFIRYKNGDIIYKTGDLGRFLADGNIELFGRSDNQIKLRGFRIEPGEIENLLSQLSGVKEAVVKVHRFEDSDERLVAFLNVDPEFKMNSDEITSSLSQNLPGYMIPSFFQTSDGFPRLPNGKINKKALLLEIDESDKEPEIDFDSLTATQKKINSIWKDVLKIKHIPYLRNFFDIGGNSLLVIRILNKIKEELGYAMSFKDFITYPTIIESGNYIDSQTRTLDNGVDLVHLTGTTNLPLTLNQKRIWLISKLQPDIPSYIIPFTEKLSGPLDLEIFQKSIDILFQRHNILFSVIKEVKGEPVCDILISGVNIAFTDYSGLPGNEMSEKVRDIFKADSEEVFNLENGPLYRLYLIRTGVEEYYFRVSIHHIVFDGWSWGVLVKDLNEIYNSLLRGKEIVMDKIEFQLYDYANWERGEVGSKHGDESKGFWKENLQGASSILNFPYDFPRREQPTGKASYVTLQLSRELTEKLRNMSKKQNSSLFATMLSAFSLQMQKYTGEDDINIGLPVAYRPHSKLENIIGMFVNTVVVRLKNEEGFSFTDIIHKTNEAALIAIAHQDLPFEKIVEIVNPERSTRVNPLFQVAFDWQNNLGEQLKLDNVTCESIAPTERTTIFDITFYLWENDGQIMGDIEYNTDILRRDTIIRFKDNFINLLHCVIENPEKAVSEISLISETDKNMLSQFNQTEFLIPDCSVQNSFENQVKLTPFKTAVISGERSITYQKLDDKSNQLANYLVSLGVNPGDIVGVCIERSVDMVISVLGVLKAGCCYLPMDPSFPEDRISYMFEDSGARVLISQSSLKGKTGHFPATSIVLTDSDSEVISKYSTAKPQIRIDNQSLAYIIYTSGSTGKPKGVKVHHESVVNLIESMAKAPGIKADDILLAVVTLSFDMSVFELFVTLSKGATVVVAGSQDTADGQELIKLIDRYNINMLQATPSLWNILLASGWKGKRDLRAFCGGEALTRNLLRQVLPNVSEFWNCYGPTETTVYSTILRITDSESPILIGKPINNTRIYILDKNRKPVPIGVVGEVCIGGLGVTKGYNNKPELTAEKFIRYENDEIIYKTGDLGRFLTDGNIELFGRIDNQIKLRGFRIEPGEIESLLSQLKGVKEAVVKIHRFEENDERLVAFLNIDTGFNLKKEEIVKSLSNHLPAYMIPSFFQMSDGFPKLPNGKINKKALILKIDESDRKRDVDIQLDTFTPSELIIYDIWREALKNNEISKTDNFFDVGGNSMLAISVFSKIESAFNLDLGLRVFFDSPRIKSLAEAIELFMLKPIENKSSERATGEEARIVEGEI